MKNCKKQKFPQISRYLKCFLVILMLYQPLTSGAYAYAEIARIQGRNVNLSLQAPLQIEDIEALSSIDQEATTDIEGEGVEEIPTDE